VAPADRAGRVAARHRSQRPEAARSSCSTAIPFQRSVRAAWVLLDPACRSRSVDRVEITEDASSSLYGNMAMGGVINIITSRPARARTIELAPDLRPTTTARSSTSSPATSGTRSRRSCKAASCRPTASRIVGGDRARVRIDNNADVRLQETSPAKLGIQSLRFRVQGFVRCRATSPRTGTTARSAS